MYQGYDVTQSRMMNRNNHYQDMGAPPYYGIPPMNMPPPNKDSMSFKINKDAANVPSHLSSPYRKNNYNKNNFYNNKSPENWNTDINSLQQNNLPPNNVLQNNIPPNNIPLNGWNNYRNRNNYIDYQARNPQFISTPPPSSQPFIPTNNPGQFNQYGASNSRSNNNFYNTGTKQQINKNNIKNNFGGKTNNYGYNGNPNNRNNQQINTFPTNVGIFNANEDSYWKNPNDEILKKQKDDGTSIWGDPSKRISCSIKRWIIPSIPDLVEGSASSDKKEGKCKIIVATGWGDENECKDSNKDFYKKSSEDTSSRDENHWSPDNCNVFDNQDSSDWNIPSNFSNANNDYNSQELLKIAVSKNLINRNLLNRIFDPQSTVIYNHLLSLISQVCAMEEKLDNIRRYEMPQNNYEHSQTHNSLIIKVAKIKNEISALSENLSNRAFGNNLINNPHKDINLAAFTDDYSLENGTTSNYQFDSATAAVSRSLANLDISGDTTDHLFHNDIWK
uniref:YTH domain-containing protein n=1 Tax=Parastrongyloides trichosuri TaxID=131310 RepID=A0A0N4ZAT8_PARTI